MAGSAGSGGAAGPSGFAAGGAAVVTSEPERCEPAFSPILDGYLAIDPGISGGTGLTADFDGDGRPDVVLTDGMEQVALLRGNGDGTLGPAVVYPTGLSFVFGGPDVVTEFLLASDMNGDGRLDIVTATKGDDAVAVLLGEATGGVAPGTTCPLAGSPQGLVTGDFDGDGARDIAVAYRGQGTSGVTLLRGDGSCTSFGELLDGTYVSVLGSGDLNGDGKLDLFVVGEGWDVLLGDGTGAFVPGAHGTDTGSAASLVVQDLNRDGKLDIAITSACSPWSSSNVAVYLGLGDGSFTREVDYEPGPCGPAVVVADVNGDGVVDLLSGPGETLPGNGDGSFGPVVASSAAYGGSLFGVGDFDGDGVEDVVAGDSDSVVVRKGNGDGTFGFVPAVQTGASPQSFALADMNGDGKLDIVTGNGTVSEPNSGSVSLALGAGNGTFAAHIDYPAGPVPYGLTPADIDGDGRPDLVALSSGNQSFSVLLQTSAGGFANPLTVTLPYSVHGLAVGDVDGDAKLDIVVVGSSPSSLSVLLGTGDGTFVAEPTIYLDDEPTNLTLFDADGDGRLDLAIAYVWSNILGVSLGRGDGSFAPVTEISLDHPAVLAAGDLNRDGRADLVSSNWWSTTVYLGNGDGSFGSITNYPLWGAYVAISDLDGDGYADVLLGQPGLTVYRGTGDGSLTCFQTYAIGGDTSQFGVGDVNGDGRRDVVALELQTGVSVFLNAPP